MRHLAISAIVYATCQFAHLAQAADAEPQVAGGNQAQQNVPRLVGQLLVGTSGVEPGFAAEWTLDSHPALRLRPELFMHDFEDPGFGFSVLWQMPWQLPHDQEIFLGPRFAYHNDDDKKGELDAMMIYDLPIQPEQSHHHHIELIGALGLLDDGGDLTVGLSLGAAYAYRF